jgi:hypothetical protein
MDDEALGARDSSDQTAALLATSFLVLFLVLAFLRALSEPPIVANSIASVEAGYAATFATTLR